MSAFCSGLCNEISKCCYDFYHAPFTKKNLLIGGGTLLGLIILIIIIVVATGGNHHNPTTAEELIKRYPLVDGANSMSKNIKYLLMDKIGTLKHGLSKGSLQCSSCQTDLDRLMLGHVSTQVFSVTTNCTAQYKDAVSQTLEQIDLLKRIVASNKTLRLVQEPLDIGKVFTEGKLGVIISVWGGHNIDSRLAILRMYYDLGVRVMALVSAEPTSNTTCTPPWVVGDKLTDFGKKIVGEMNRLGMIIDLTGCSSSLMQDVLSETKASVIFSHSGSQTKTENNLNVQDSVLEQHKSKIGLIMVPFTPHQLVSNDSSKIEDVAEHLDWLYKITQDTKKLGIGSNFDDMIKVTEKLEDVSKFVNLISYLKERKTPKDGVTWTDATLEQLISKNFIEVFKDVLKVARNITSGPDESIIDQKEIEKYDQCYTDMAERYNDKIPTEAPTTQPPTTPTKPTVKPTTKNNSLST